MHQRPGNRSSFTARWILFCGLGWTAGMVAAFALAVPVEALVGMMLVTPVILSITGTALGTSQWLAIRRTVRSGARWIVASALGLGLGMTLGVVLVEVIGRALTGDQVRLVSVGPVGKVLGLALIGALAGAGAGLAQRLALRAVTPVPARWIAWSIAGLGLGLPTGGLVVDLLPGGLTHPAGFGLFLAIAGFAAAALTVRGATVLREALSATG